MSIGTNDTKHTKETIQQGFLLDFKGIFSISEFPKKPFKTLTISISLIAWIVFSVWVFIWNIPRYDLIVDMVSNIIVWIPSILGFTIGGYGFLIGFIQSNLMQKISEPRQGSPFSLFQVASASFACNILIQALTLAIAFVVHFAIYLDARRSKLIHLPTYITSLVNNATFLLVGCIFALSLAVTVQIVVNVFNFSQLHHYNTVKGKLDAKEREAKQASNSGDEN